MRGWGPGPHFPHVHTAHGSQPDAGSVMVWAQDSPAQCRFGCVTGYVFMPQCPHYELALSNTLSITGLVRSWLLSKVSCNRA